MDTYTPIATEGSAFALSRSVFVVSYSSKCNIVRENCTLDCTLDEIKVLSILKKEPKLTQKQLAEMIGKC